MQSSLSVIWEPPWQRHDPLCVPMASGSSLSPHSSPPGNGSRVMAPKRADPETASPLLRKFLSLPGHSGEQHTGGKQEKRSAGILPPMTSPDGSVFFLASPAGPRPGLAWLVPSIHSEALAGRPSHGRQPPMKPVGGRAVSYGVWTVCQACYTYTCSSVRDAVSLPRDTPSLPPVCPLSDRCADRSPSRPGGHTNTHSHPA